jgi:hypothetical protein
MDTMFTLRSHASLLRNHLAVSCRLAGRQSSLHECLCLTPIELKSQEAGFADLILFLISKIFFTVEHSSVAF